MAATPSMPRLRPAYFRPLLEPHNTGLGGDSFAFVWRADQRRLHAIEGAGWSPAALDDRWLQAQGHSSIDVDSIHSITVPGAVDAWARLLRDHGTLSWADALAPAIALAERGFVVAERCAHDTALGHALDAGGRQAIGSIAGDDLEVRQVVGSNQRSPMASDCPRPHQGRQFGRATARLFADNHVRSIQTTPLSQLRPLSFEADLG